MAFYLANLLAFYLAYILSDILSGNPRIKMINLLISGAIVDSKGLN